MFQHLVLDEKYLQLVFLNFSFLLLQKTLELENTYDLAPFTVLTFLYVSYVPMQAGQARSQILVKVMDDYGFGVSAAFNETTESMVAETENLAISIFRVDEDSPVRRSFFVLLLISTSMKSTHLIRNFEHCSPIVLSQLAASAFSQRKFEILG